MDGLPSGGISVSSQMVCRPRLFRGELEALEPPGCWRSDAPARRLLPVSLLAEVTFWFLSSFSRLISLSHSSSVCRSVHRRSRASVTRRSDLAKLGSL